MHNNKTITIVIFLLYVCFIISWTTIVVHSWDNQGVGVAHEIQPSKNWHQFSQTMIGQYWLDKSKPKQAFRSTWNSFKKLLQSLNFLFNRILTDRLTGCLTDWQTDCLTDWLMPSDKHNSIMVNAMSLIFSLFDIITSAWDAVCTMHSSWTNHCPPLCSIHLHSYFYSVWRCFLYSSWFVCYVTA